MIRFIKHATTPIVFTAFMALSVFTQAEIESLVNQEVKIVNRNSGKALSIANISTGNGALAVQNSYSGSADQHWVIEEVGQDSYRIINAQSGKALEIADGAHANGDAARQWDYFNVSHHQWQVNEVESGFYQFINLASSKALEIADGSTAEGAAARQWDYFPVSHHQWSISPTGQNTSDLAIQAENGNISGGSIVSDGNAENSSYFSLGADGQVDFSLSVPESGNYAIKIRYRSPYGLKLQKFVINNGSPTTYGFSEASNWTEASTSVAFTAGSNTFSIKADWGYVDIDRVTFIGAQASSPVANDLYVEAESAALCSGASQGADTSASAGAYASLNAEGKVKLAIEGANAGTYNLVIGYRAPWGDKVQDIVVNEQSATQLTFTNSTEWSEVSTSISLASGNNTLAVNANWGYIDIDYVKIEGLSASQANATCSSALFWNFNIVDVAQFDWWGGNPSADSYRAKVGTLNESAYEDGGLPSAGNRGIYTEIYDSLGYHSYVLDLETGDIIEITRRRSSPGGSWNGAPSSAVTPYANSGDNTQYRNTLDTMINNIQIIIDRTSGNDAVKADFQIAIDYLNSVKSSAN